MTYYTPKIVKGDWIATAVLKHGATKKGWIHNSQVKRHAVEHPIYPTLGELVHSEFSSAGVLAQKGKIFDDGLYAAVELAAQDGLGDFAGKRSLLKTLVEKLADARESEIGGAEEIVLAAGKLGGVANQVSGDVTERVNARVNEFRGNSLRSKPLAFYTWSDELSLIYQQDRMLQSPIEAIAPGPLLSALHADKQSRHTYEQYLNLASRLTNPLSKPDFRQRLDAMDEGKPAAPRTVSFFPSSRSRETDLIDQLFRRGPIPDGFNLADEMVTRIRDGRLDLSPTTESGWYDYQTWALEPMVVPDRMPEGKRIWLGKDYREHLTDLFKGVYALTRETHIKQEAVPEAPGEFDEEPKPRLHVRAEVSSEPLPTYFLRRAQSYRFVRNVVENTFGQNSLEKMHRQTANGPVKHNLDDELRDVERLFYGAYVTVSRQLGMNSTDTPKFGSGDANADASYFLNWTANLALDLDVASDVRMMVPVFYDNERKQPKVWMMLGWQVRPVYVGFRRQPLVQVYGKDGNRLGADDYELSFESTSYSVVTPVTTEVYVDEVLNRDEFRKLLDTLPRRSVALHHLRARSNN